MVYDLFCFNGINKDRRLLLVSLKITLDSQKNGQLLEISVLRKTLAVVGLSFLMQTHVFKNYGNLSKVLLYFLHSFTQQNCVTMCLFMDKISCFQ